MRSRVGTGWPGWIGLVARVVVGGVWLWAGLLKLPDPETSITAVRAYQLLPTPAAELVGRGLPIVEVLVGACLVLGLITRASGVLSAVLQVAFIVGIASVWARGISIDCGCFGDGGYDADAFSKYPWEIARDTGLLALSVVVVWVRRTPWALDNRVLPDQHGSEHQPENERVDVEATA